MALRSVHIRLRRFSSVLVVSIVCAGTAFAASYLPLSDADLARRSPVIVRATAVASEVRRGADGAISTVATLSVVEPIRAAELAAGDTLSLELPGGIDGDTASLAPGTPQFVVGVESVLFLDRGADGHWSLTEFGMSKFDLAVDADGRAFAVRPVFADDEDDRASGLPMRRTASAAAPGGTSGAPRRLRDAASFLAMLRATSAAPGAPEGAPAPFVVYASPNGALRAPAPPRPSGSRRPSWVNIGGVEGTGAQFRWFWDTGLSPAAIVSASGTQTGLSDGSNGVAAVQNGAAAWSSVPNTLVRYGSSSGTGPVVVHLDVDSKSPAWTSTLSCASGGVIGYGGPGSSRSAGAFKGDSSFFAPTGGDVWMRKVTGGCYNAATFRSAVLHEVGHTIGLGHSDEGESTHSTTTSADWNAAVMHSVIPAAHPTVPQADDVQAIQYYYGTGSTTPPPSAPSASFTFSPGSPAAGQGISFHDASTGSPTSWVWTFGDGTSALTANPSHTYAAAGTYTVSLSVTNAGGTGTTSRSITVAAAPVGCGAGALCLNGNRFRVTAAWRIPSGASGAGVPVPLTGDTGYFWFFSSNNVELVVKVVDGRAVNGRFWVFSGALSDVEYTLTILDTVTGAVRTYSNPQGTLASRADTAAFLPATE